MDALKSPYPYFGGKSAVAGIVWQRLGDVGNYVEPFFGSGAALLARPHEPRIETVNDLCGFIANFWRAIRHDPEAVAYHADSPVNENDLHAIHAWLVERKDSLAPRLEGNPDWYDAQIAGRWAKGICEWIGGGFCEGKGPWRVVDGELRDVRQLPHLGDAGQGIYRKLPHLGNAGRGITPKRRSGEELYEYFALLGQRLRSVRVACGDWTRVVGTSVTVHLGMTGILMDPPYSGGERTMGIYRHDSGSVAADVRDWCIRHGENENLRIALCGYAGEHAMPRNWSKVRWSASGGYGNQSNHNDNRHRETIWFSPHCLKPTEDLPLFRGLNGENDAHRTREAN